MAVTQETQAYLARTKAPAVTPATLRAALKAFLTGMGNWQTELSTQVRLLNDAMLAEADPKIRARLELENQTLGALRRVSTEAERIAIDLAPILDQFARYQADFRTTALTVDPTYIV